MGFLLYLVAGLFLLLATMGLATGKMIAVIASLTSISLIVFAVLTLQWWPIALGIGLDIGLKIVFGNPVQR